uniref:Uncharacterized protein n=2 Tax=Paracidobacterium acidisoli TaxID=2303751 RepID=A0A372IUZ6_9BACT
MHAAAAMLAIMPIFVLIVAVIVILPFWMIWKKAGFTPWLSLLMFVPLVGIIMLYVLAFAEWKVVPAQRVYPAGYPPSTLPPQL